METILAVKVHYILVPDGFRFDPEALSPARRANIMGMKSPAARNLSAAAGYALNAALTDFLPGYAPPPALSYAGDGSPRVPGAEISIAHTPGLAACAVAREPVGLDVERADRDLTRIKKKILSPAEQEGMHPLLDLWVAKEAYLKLTGEGLAGGMHNYTVEGDVIRDKEGVFRASLLFTSIPGYRLAVCCKAPFRLETMRVG